ncbi:putative ABC transporter ATP-binding protein YxlF [Stieleria neptunia]|uniref:Putative ABC transporter ATP-binding protein YxlF n=1 Tax=Stieleria neptunia TaxID=2527979 RepID=A0A518HVG5_9BACT|nr:ABC transporter ATP-binding protein [Stieleria neptunia]QDV44793.1 putative ABC transporter ATP-binding protein YxlF [Stieleria neptunia]
MIHAESPALEIVNLRKKYGRLEALRGVEFELSRGECLAFLGPNGAGKTTLIRALAGRTRPTAGTIKVFGHPIDSIGARQALGLVPQDLALYGDLTTRENLVAFGKFHGVPRRELKKRIDWALQWTGLADRAKDLVGGFSGGMKRRVNLACGVLHRPKIILLDEPTVGVDPQSRERIFTMLDQLNDEGASILLTTHHLDEAEQRSDRIVILDQGRVIADGTIDELVLSTVGHSRLVRVRVDRPLTAPVAVPLTVPGNGEQRRTYHVGQAGRELIETRIDDVTVHLGPFLQAVQNNGYQVSDMEVQAPSLHHVFLHLTGNELRD